MPEIEKYKTVFIKQILENYDNFDYHIDIPFEVDEIVLKSIAISNYEIIAAVPGTPGGTGYVPAQQQLSQSKLMTEIRTTLVPGNVLFCYPSIQVLNESYNIPFKLDKGNGFINSTYNFKFIETNGTDLTNHNVSIGMCLLFIKYKDEKK